MITITGLTERQKQVIDLLWTCTTLDAAQQLIRALPTHRDRCDAQSLLTIVAWESIEQQEGLDAYKTAAAACIAHASS